MMEFKKCSTLDELVAEYGDKLSSPITFERLQGMINDRLNRGQTEEEAFKGLTNTLEFLYGLQFV